MTTYQKHLLANRQRRIPRRVREIKAELNSFDLRCTAIENDESITDEYRKFEIRNIRDRTAPLHTQLRGLSDRAAELGIRVS